MFVVNPILRQYLIVMAVNLMILSVGMDIGWSSPVLVKLRDSAQTPLSHPISEDESGWIISIGYVISIFTLPLIGLLVDYIGRKYSILVLSLPKIIAGVTTIIATEAWMLLLARAINITMDTAATTIVMIYSMEISSKEIRGSLGSIMSILSCMGSLLMLGIGPYVSYLTLNVMLTAVAICASFPLFFIPDTPYSLYKKGKIEEAKNVLAFFRGSETLAEEEFKELSQMEPAQQADKREIFQNTTYLKTLLIVVTIGIGVQFNGFYFLLFYLQTILEITNTNISSEVCSLSIGVIQVLGSIFASTVSDRFGRKLISITSLLGITLGMVGLGIFFVVKQHSNITGFLNYLPLLSIALVTFCYCGGVGSQYLVLTTEVLDNKIRAIGTSASIVAAIVSTFLLSRYTLAILSALGAIASFFMFGAICIMLSLFFFFFVPETKHRTIADIQRSLGQTKTGEKKDCMTQF